MLQFDHATHTTNVKLGLNAGIFSKERSVKKKVESTIGYVRGTYAE